MTRYVNRWTALYAWAALMGIVWAVFVPRGVTVSSFILLSLTGPLVVVAASMLWSAHPPTPSLGQMRVESDVTDAVRRTQR
jgi:hypothetical protein